MKCHLFILINLVAISALSQADPFPKGSILDSIPVMNSENEHYTLYLPTGYTVDTGSSIVFIFDPGGRGKVGIRPFIAAAEKFNLILVCSNNSRNTAYEENFAIAERWFRDIFGRFTIDEKNIYAAGFSGGSRLASTIGVLSGSFKGVVGCGAAFSVNAGQMPYNSDHFYYVGLVGHLDMNYQEMFQASDWLSRIGLPHEIITFEGDHRWPDPEDILLAFDWFYLQDIKNGNRPRDEVFLNEYLSSQLSKAQLLLKEKQLSDAVRTYDRISQNLGPYFTLDSLAQKTKGIKRSKEFKRSLRELEKIEKEEQIWTDKLIGRIRKELETEQIPQDFSWWRKELGVLNEDVAQNDLKAYQYMGKRLQNMIFAVSIENLDAAVANRNEKEVAYYTRLMMANWPENAFVCFRIASSHATLGHDVKALDYLSQAIDHGWKNKDWILNTQAFRRLQGNKEFQSLLEQIQ